jgi:mannitol-1-phosphate 5-dehydrogenase
MHRSAEALARRYPDSFSRSSLAEHVEDLLARFRNTALGDTVYRVGRDLPRKLRRDDRIVGAIATAIEQGVDPAPIAEVFRAAPRFAKPGPDGSLFPADAQFAARYSHEVTDRMLEEVVGIGADERELRAVLRGDE